MGGWFTTTLMHEAGAAALDEMDVFHMSYNNAQGRVLRVQLN